MTIPNIFHFINIGPREFNLLHYLSIMSAYTLNKPDAIYLYCEYEQKDNVFWELLKDIITIVKIEPPTEYKGVLLDSYPYKADIIRMQKLIEMGGIYMDLDIISLKPLTCFLDRDIVMGAEACDSPDTTDVRQFKSITNAVILTEPNNPFMKQWFDEMAYNINGKPWAYHAVYLPKLMLERENNYNVWLEPKKTFMPFCFRDNFIFRSEMKHKRYLLNDSYTIHLWENIWKNEYISKLDIEYFNTNNNLFTELFDHYLDNIYDNIDILVDIIQNSYKLGNTEKTTYYGKMYLDLCERYNSKICIDNICMIYKKSDDNICRASRINKQRISNTKINTNRLFRNNTILQAFAEI